VALDLRISKGFWSVKRIVACAITVEKRDTGHETVENQGKVRHHLLLFITMIIIIICNYGMLILTFLQYILCRALQRKVALKNIIIQCKT